MALVPDPQNIRLAMLGMVDGNGHPYSWSAIINGEYDAEAMAACGYPVIPQYLGAQPREALGIPGARVTHVWCDSRPMRSRSRGRRTSPHVVTRPEEVLGQVDAVIIPTDKGWEHVARARPFVEAGLPVFVDKPLVDRAEDLRQFIRWQQTGKPLLSTSCMRYAREFAALRGRLDELGALRLITITTPKSLGTLRDSRPGSRVSVSPAGRLAERGQHGHRAGQHRTRPASRRRRRGVGGGG